MLNILLILLLMIPTNGWCTVQWNVNLPASGDNLTSWPAAVKSQWSILETLVSNYRRGMAILYKNSTTITVSVGEVVVSNSGASTRLFLKNSSNTDITASNLDSGSSFSSSTTYYIYAGTSTATDASATFYISLSSSAPTGVTYYQQIGSFTTDGSANIVIYNVLTSAYSPSAVDANGKSLIFPIIYDYGSSNSSSTQRYSNQLKMAYGTGISIGGGTSVSLSGLPFTSSSTYTITVSETGGSGSDESRGSVGGTQSSGSTGTLYNTDNTSHSVNWFAIGY